MASLHTISEVAGRDFKTADKGKYYKNNKGGKRVQKQMAVSGDAGGGGGVRAGAAVQRVYSEGGNTHDSNRGNTHGMGAADSRDEAGRGKYIR